MIPTVQSLLRLLDLGKSVAEFDNDLERYFIETNVFLEFINDRVDVVAGDKARAKPQYIASYRDVTGITPN